MIAPLEWRGQLVESRWWGQIEYWGLFLATRGYDGWISMGPGVTASVFDQISCASCGQGRSIHLMMAGAFARPEQFTPGADDHSALHSVQTAAAVASPSFKGLLIHLRGLAHPLTTVSFCDGHGELISASAMAPGVDAQLPYAPMPVVQTRRGILGRDR